MTTCIALVVDLDGQWVEDAFQHLDDSNYRACLYRFLRKHGRHDVLRIIMASVEMFRRIKIANSLRGQKKSLETRTKMSAANTSMNNHWYGKTHTKEHKAKISASMTERWKDPEFRINHIGKNHSNWQNGKSFEPYCPAFNEEQKEQIRNRDGRTCVLCGKGEIQNGERLTVHHIDGDKMQGCNGTKWYLCALCRSCNSKPDTFEKEFLIVSNLRFLES